MSSTDHSGGSGESSFADSQQSRRRLAKPAALPCRPYVARGSLEMHTATLGVGPTQSASPWSDCGQAYALAGTSPTYSRVRAADLIGGQEAAAMSCSPHVVLGRFVPGPPPSPRLLLEINICERLSVVVADDKTYVGFLDGPRRRKTTRRHGRK
jgi:hypothetical protein